MPTTEKRDSAASSRKSARSSFFDRIRNSLHGRNKSRDADVHALRGTTGAEFENVGRIVRTSGVGDWCCCLFGSLRSSKNRFLLIKGPSLFVFVDQDAPSPIYAVPLLGTTARVGKDNTVCLERTLGEQLYEISFDSGEVAREFARVVEAQAAAAQTDETRKRLGHDKLLRKRASYYHAAAVAKTKAKDQPDTPISSEDIMKNMPMNAM